MLFKYTEDLSLKSTFLLSGYIQKNLFVVVWITNEEFNIFELIFILLDIAKVDSEINNILTINKIGRLNDSFISDVHYKTIVYVLIILHYHRLQETKNDKKTLANIESAHTQFIRSCIHNYEWN